MKSDVAQKKTAWAIQNVQDAVCLLDGGRKTHVKKVQCNNLNQEKQLIATMFNSYNKEK